LSVISKREQTFLSLGQTEENNIEKNPSRFLLHLELALGNVVLTTCLGSGPARPGEA
jgi:hypothetical protein